MFDLAGFFMKIFVISLTDASRRRASAVDQFKQIGLEFEFFDAVECVGCTSEYFNDINRRLYRLNTLRDPLPGEIGCYASHLALWRICVAMNQPIEILEDDFQLAAGFSEAIREIETLTNTYGFIRLQSIERGRKPLKKLRPAAYELFSYKGRKLLYVSDVPLCMLAYAISPAAASSLLKASATLIAPVDKFLQQTWVHMTPIYALDPAVVALSSHAESSTIGTRPRKSLNPGLLLGRALYKGLGELRRYGFDKKQLKTLDISDSEDRLRRDYDILG